MIRVPPPLYFPLSASLPPAPPSPLGAAVVFASSSGGMVNIKLELIALSHMECAPCVNLTRRPPCVSPCISVLVGPIDYLHSYMIENGICYLTLADKGYPKRLAFLYLEEVHQEFVDELRRDYGEGWRNKASVRSSSSLLSLLLLLLLLLSLLFFPTPHLQRFCFCEHLCFVCLFVRSFSVLFCFFPSTVCIGSRHGSGR